MTTSSRSDDRISAALADCIPGEVTIRGVRFAMSDLGDLVDVLVTHAALDRMEDPASSDYLSRFDRHRATFERVANDKYARGEIEDDGSIALLPGDF